MKSFFFDSKADTLKFISNKLSNAKILPILTVESDEFFRKKNKVISKIQNYFEEPMLIVRSSCKREDTIKTSNAGRYESVLNVDKNNYDNLKNAIEKVFESYGRSDGEMVLIQPMLKNITESGVAFTCDLDTLTPYYIINYDESGESDIVTGGLKGNIKTYIFFKESPVTPKEECLNKIIGCLKELEKIFSSPYLDVEFGIDTNGDLYIFQVRPVVVNNKNDLSSINIKDSLRKIHKKIEKLMAPHPNLLGDKTIFGVMPDWNPAEIIGIRPKKLAISLYKDLIMDSIWAYQRDNYGYRNLRSHPLMVSFLGIPYIDVRVSFNSFIPKMLNDEIADKLLNFYLKKLIDKPSYHDKVEFKIVHSCYYLNLPQKLRELSTGGFSENEIKRIEFALLQVTNRIIHPEYGLYKQDIKKIKTLVKKYDEILNSKLSIVDKIYWLLEDCKRYGTLPFAGVARAAFIAIQFLNSFVDLEIITLEEYQAFMNSLNTINKQMSKDLFKVFEGTMKKTDFLNIYGHIRPGTYDILSFRYDENFEYYFGKNYMEQDDDKQFVFTETQKKKISKALVENGVEVNVEELLIFIKESIEGREYTKYIFSKSLSKALQLVEEFGNKYGIHREDLAFLDIQKIKELHSTLDHRDVKDIFNSDIEKNKIFYQYTKAVKLPSLIINPSDVYGCYLLDEEPNFITLKSIKARVVQEKEINNMDLQSKIVMVQSADPGYDFLFSKNIGGLITQYGGANSHMAIRCAELGIPAVIGAGERFFSKWSRMKVLELDSLNKQVRCLE